MPWKRRTMNPLRAAGADESSAPPPAATAGVLRPYRAGFGFLTPSTKRPTCSGPSSSIAVASSPHTAHDPPVPRNLPSGTVTFLFTDVEGSTRLLHELGPE